MGLNSCLYEINIWHDRRSPKRYSFEHKVFMFYLDLDELDQLSKQSWLVEYHSWALYNFKDQDHILTSGQTAKESILAYVRKMGLTQEVAKVKLLTNLRSFGYIFNPVSFYFCFDPNGVPLCVVVQIGNTFGELKYFYLGSEKCLEKKFSDFQTKYYYISPFTDLDNVLDFQVQLPDDRLRIIIDVIKRGEKFFYSSMIGQRQELNTSNLLFNTMKYPFVTLKVIFFIHWHAAILHFLKKVSHHPKEENPQDQREVYRPWIK